MNTIGTGAVALDAIASVDALEIERVIVAGLDLGARTAVILSALWYEYIVMHNYRWRPSLALAERQYDELEARLFEGPVLTVPTITIGSDFDGSNTDGHAYAQRFSDPYSHRILDGIGHAVPQEAPEAFAGAILEVGAAK